MNFNKQYSVICQTNKIVSHWLKLYFSEFKLYQFDFCNKVYLIESKLYHHI